MLMMTCFEAQKEGVWFLWYIYIEVCYLLQFYTWPEYHQSLDFINCSWPGYNLVSLLELSQSKILPESPNRLFPRVHVTLSYFSILLHCMSNRKFYILRLFKAMIKDLSWQLIGEFGLIYARQSSWFCLNVNCSSSKQLLMM